MNKFTASVAVLIAVLLHGCGSEPSSYDNGSATGSDSPTETYRLIHAIGNDENEVDRGLSKSECHRRRDDLKKTATALGTYNEATGHGSITCLPESFF